MMYQGMGIIAVLTLTACAQWQIVTQTGHNEVCEGITHFYTAASLLSPEAGKEMLQALRENQAQEGDNPCDQLRLVILLGRPDTVFHDDTEAARLLQDFLNNPDHAQHHDRGLALLMADNIKGRQQLQEKLLSREKSLALEQAVSQKLAEKLRREHTAAKALKSQLEQLKSIEQDINEKEQSAAAPNGQ